jgi:carbamoyl-phosphate synthase large subunit
MVPLAIRQLKESRRHSIRVIAVNEKPGVAAQVMADTFHVVPSGGDSGYADAVLRICESEPGALVLPWSDEEALTLAPKAAEFRMVGATLMCATPETLCMMSDKAASFAHLTQHKIPVPEWHLAHNDEELMGRLDDLLARRGAAAVKPERSRGGRNVYVIRPEEQKRFDIGAGREVHLSPREFQAMTPEARAKLLPALVMERLVPPGYDIDVLCRGGEVLRSVPRRRINPAGIPFMGGVVINHAELHDLATRVVAAFNLDWLYDIDVFSTMSGELRVMETNPRPSGSLPATVAAGIPLFDDLISLAHGEALPPLALPALSLVLPFTDTVATTDSTLIAGMLS